MKAKVWMIGAVWMLAVSASQSWANESKWFAHSSYAIHDQHVAALDVVKNWAIDATSHISGAVDYQYKVRSTSAGHFVSVKLVSKSVGDVVGHFSIMVDRANTAHVVFSSL